MNIKLFTIPNFLTLGNLLCGAVSVIFLSWGEPWLAFCLVVASAVFDFFDGFVARLMHTPPALGIELDSLADMVSFGLVPAAVLVHLYHAAPQWGDYPSWLVSACYAVPLVIAAASALRLAKFNIDDSQHTEFCGLPTPANALLCVSLAALASSGKLTLTREAVVLISLASAWLLVSPVRMFSLKFSGFGWKGNELRYCFLAVSLCAIAVLRAYSVPTIIVLYIVISLVRWVPTLRRRA